MPLWPEYHSAIDSPFADMQNSGQNSPGAITAGCFLAKFTGEYRWAHLDIAGSAFTYGKGNSATGRPVQMLIRFLQNLTNTSK
jgi:leucyl aminopeptidase